MKTLTLRTNWLLTLALLLTAPTAPAQWTNDPYNGMVPVCTAEGAQEIIKVCRLANNRTFIAWADQRELSHKIYYQILNSQGFPQLPINGLPLIDANWIIAWTANVTTVVSDGEGGCIAIFRDFRDGTYDLYGQRIDVWGNRLWGATGVPIAIWSGTQSLSMKDVVCDSFGHFFVSYAVQIGSNNCDMYMQRFNREGQRLWGDYGVVVCNLSGSDSDIQQSVVDGRGGVIDVWMDDRSGDFHFYAQRLDSLGNWLWAPYGIPLSHPQTGDPIWGYLADGVPDGASGGIFSYDTFWNWYLMRLDSTGQVQWLYSQYLPDTTYAGPPLLHPADGSIWLATRETRQGSGWNNYLYRFNLQGAPLFPTTGIILPEGDWLPSLVATSNGVLVFTSANQTPLSYIQATNILSSGSIYWNINVALYRGGMDWEYPMSISDNNDGALCAWCDWRYWTVSWLDVFAQRVLADGSLGNPLPPYPHAPDYPHYNLSQIGRTIHFTLPQAGEITLELYDLMGRKVAILVAGYHPVGEHQIYITIDKLASGLYFLKLETAQGWQLLKLPIIK